MNERLKKIIFNKLYDDLRHVEIIPYEDKIWFIDRKNKYWYFIYNKNDNDLWWRYDYFRNYFDLFSLGEADSEYVMSRWVEEVLNSRVSTTSSPTWLPSALVEDVLNSRVSTTEFYAGLLKLEVEDVLNSEVNIAWSTRTHRGTVVEDVLSAKVKKTIAGEQKIEGILEGVLNSKKDVVQGQSQGQSVSDTKDVVNYPTTKDGWASEI